MIGPINDPTKHPDEVLYATHGARCRNTAEIHKLTRSDPPEFRRVSFYILKRWRFPGTRNMWSAFRYTVMP